MSPDPPPGYYLDWARDKASIVIHYPQRPVHRVWKSVRRDTQRVWEGVRRDTQKAFGNRGIRIIEIYILLGILFLIIPYGTQVNTTSIYYMLSAQAQVLGTLFGILFTTTVVSVQIVRKYSQKQLEDLLGGWILLYVLPYIWGILLPLFMLRINSSLLWASLCILLGGLCVIILIPFYTVLSRLLTAGHHISIVEDKAKSAVDKYENKDNFEFNDMTKQISENVKIIREIAIGSVDRNNYSAFKESLSSVKRVLKYLSRRLNRYSVEENKTYNVREIGFELSHVARGTIGHPRAPFLVTDVLRDTGDFGASRGTPPIATTNILSLRKIGQYAIRKRPIGDLAIRISRFIAKIGSSAAEHKSYSVAFEAVQALTDLTADDKLSDLAKSNSLRGEVIGGVGDVSSSILSKSNPSTRPDIWKRVFAVVYEHISLVRSHKSKVVALNVTRTYERITRKLLINGSSLTMDDQSKKELASKSMDSILKISKTVKEKGDEGEKTETARSLTYAVQHAIDAEMYEKSEEVFDVLDSIVRNTIDEANASSTIWEISASLGYAVKSCLKTEKELGNKAHKLLTDVTDRACEVSIPNERLQNLLDAHEDIVEKIA